MIRKLKRRYFISNMALLSTTLLIGLGILFGILYRSEVNASYSLMNQMIDQSELPEKDADENVFEPTSYVFDESGEKATNSVNEYQSPEQKPEQAQPNMDGQTANSDFWQPTWPDGSNSYWDNPWGTNPWESNDNAWEDDWGQNDWWNNNWWMSQEDTNVAETEPVVTEPVVTEPVETTPPQTELVITTSKTEKKFKKNNPLIPGWLTPVIPEPPAIHPPQLPQNNNKTEQTTATTVTNQTVTTMTTTVATKKADAKDNEKEKPDKKGNPWQNEQNKENSAAEKRNPKEKQQSDTTEAVGTKPTIVVLPKSTPVEEEIPDESNAQTPDALVARIDENGNIAVFDVTDNQEEELEQNDSAEALNIANQAIDRINKDGENSGTVKVNNKPYRYLKRESHLVMLNRTLELSAISRLMFVFLFLAVSGLLGVFFVSELLANWTVKPISMAWEKQKQFVADASHELKTPLAVISANTEVIMSNPEASVTGQSKWIHYIQSETTRMSKLITNLLSIARMDHKKEGEPVSLLQASDLVANVCLVFEPIAFENGKMLNSDIQENLTLRGDEDNLKQLLSILLDNAVIHSAPNAEISVKLAKDTFGKISLTVSNSAKDIPQEQLEHLFDRFYRVDTEGNPNGSGLGLSIAKSIVTQMGGTLTATSENNLVTFTAIF